MLSLRPLFEILAYRGINKTELAEKTGIPYTAILRMYKENTFKTSHLDKICTALNVNIKDIMIYIPEQTCQSEQ